MKKIIFTMLLLTAGTASFAQFSGGIKAGVNLAKQKWEVSGDSEDASGTSFHIGAYGNFALGGAISIQPELLYNSLKFDTKDLLGEETTLNYISVPVMFVYGFSDNKFNVQAGPQLNLLMSTDPSEIKDDDFYKGSDFALNFGAGANFGKFNATLRYCLGLSSIASDDLVDAFAALGADDLTIKNNNFQLSVGYKLFGE